MENRKKEAKQMFYSRIFMKATFLLDVLKIIGKIW